MTVRVLFVSSTEWWGGGESTLLRLTRLDSIEATVATPVGEACAIFRDAGISVLPVRWLKRPRARRRNVVLYAAEVVVSSLFCTFSLVKTIRQRRIQAVFANGVMAGVYACLAVILTGTTLSFVQRLIYRDGSLEMKALALVTRLSEVVVCVSHSVERNLRGSGAKLDSGGKSKVRVIHDVVDLPEMTSPIVETVNRGGRHVTIGVVGSLLPPKGIDIIVNVFSELYRVGCSVSLEIIGKSTGSVESQEYEVLLRQMVQRAALTHVVAFRGFQKRKDLIYGGLDIVVCYSTIPEALSIVTLEAMAYGKIVVAADAGGPTEIVVDGVTGYLVEPSNPRALFTRLRDCVENIDRPEFVELRLNARRRIEECFNDDIFAVAFEEVFAELAGRDAGAQ